MVALATAPSNAKMVKPAKTRDAHPQAVRISEFLHR